MKAILGPTMPLVVLGLAVFLSAMIGIQRPTVAQQLSAPNATLADAIAAWKQTRSETKARSF